MPKRSAASPSVAEFSIASWICRRSIFTSDCRCDDDMSGRCGARGNPRLLQRRRAVVCEYTAARSAKRGRA
jgi:hypothetical protein